MGPVVSQLERSFAGRVEVRRYVVDKLEPGTPAHAAAFDLGRRIGFERTPTYLVADAAGRPRAMATGATSYATLHLAIAGALGSESSPTPSRSP